MADYVQVFFAFNGPGPWMCWFCGENVHLDWSNPFRRGRRSLAIHHLDGNHGNDVPSNLVPAHGSCHSRYHGYLGVGRIVSNETREKIRRANTGRTYRKRTREERAVISENVRQRFQNDPIYRQRAAERMKTAWNDRSWWMCASCGEGPFRGHQAMLIHRGRTRCESEESWYCAL